MSLNLPRLASREDSLNSYCNFIEYSSFVDSEIGFDEFDVDENGLQLKDVLQELRRRLDLYDDFEPFEIKKDRVRSLLSDKESNLHYFYCLYYAILGGTSNQNITNIFEEITSRSLLTYFGTDFCHITSIGQNTANLRTTIESLPSLLKEKKGSFEEIIVQAKDGGIDIITYKPIDNRGNQLICLTDATIGKHWKREKKVLVKLNQWDKFIHFKVRPLTCLSIVHIVEDSELFAASADNGLMFDRSRIMRNFTPDPNLTEKLKNWVTTLA